MQKLYFKLLLFFLIISAHTAYAQPFFRNPIGDGYFSPGFGIQMATIFNHEDFLLDFGLGYEDLGYDFSILLSGTFRPYRKKVFYKESEGLFYQMQEQVIQFSLDIEKRFYFLEMRNGHKFGLFAALKSGYFWGRYNGFSTSQNNQFVFNPTGGFSWQFGRLARLSVGYLYYGQNPYANPHMANIKLNLLVGGKKDEEFMY